MTKERITATVEVFCGEVKKITSTYLEVAYESLAKKLECERFLRRLGVIILQGSSSDIGNLPNTHRIFLL